MFHIQAVLNRSAVRGCARWTDGWWNQCTLGWNCTNSSRSIHRHKSLSHELPSEWVSEQVRKRMSAVERSGACEQCEATERVLRANGGANGPVLYASISYCFCPLCNGSTDKPAKCKDARSKAGCTNSAIEFPPRWYSITKNLIVSL